MVGLTVPLWGCWCCCAGATMGLLVLLWGCWAAMGLLVLL